MTTQPREFPKCCRATGVDLNEWHFIKKQMIRFPQHLSSFVPQQNTRNSHRGISSGRAEHWDTMENSRFCPSAPISKPALPAAGRAELGELKGLWGAPGDAQLEQTQAQARKGDLGRASQLPAAGEFQPCTRES